MSGSRLSQPGTPVPTADDSTAALLARLAAARAIDHEIVTAFQERINLARVIDRRLGAPALLTELREQIRHMRAALHHATNQRTRTELAQVLADACALAGWLSLDQNALTDAWHYYGQARTAALESESAPLLAYTSSASAAVLIDAGERAAAIELTTYAQEIADGRAPRILRSWLAAAHGEACAADGQRDQSLRAFDRAAQLADRTDPSEAPYLVFGSIHLVRWRGSALARLGDAAAVGLLTGALHGLDPGFTRAHCSMRADLVDVLTRLGEREAAATYAADARNLAMQIGSVRQRERVRRHSAA